MAMCPAELWPAVATVIFLPAFKAAMSWSMVWYGV